MNRFVMVLAVVAGLGFSHQVLALPGVAPDGDALGQYNPATGQIIVSATNVNNWWVEHVGYSSMTGDEPFGLPISGGLITNHDSRIGESNFSEFSFVDLNLGNVAITGIPDDGSLQIFWNPGLGTPAESTALEFISSPSNNPPLVDLNGPIVVDLLNDPLNITLDASGSTDDGLPSPLTYQWDLDNDNIFEFDTNTTPTLDIADVTSTFGGHGFYPVDVRVSDGEFSAVTTTMVRLLSGPSLPPSAQYDPATGQIVVSTDGVLQWYVHSESSSLTGDEPSGLPAADGYAWNADHIIGESSFELFGYTVDLGNVAQTGLPEGDLVLYYVEGLGDVERSVPVTYGTIVPDPGGLVPEPGGLVLLLIGVFGIAMHRDR